MSQNVASIASARQPLSGFAIATHLDLAMSRECGFGAGTKHCTSACDQDDIGTVRRKRIDYKSICCCVSNEQGGLEWGGGRIDQDDACNLRAAKWLAAAVATAQNISI